MIKEKSFGGGLITAIISRGGQRSELMSFKSPAAKTTTECFVIVAGEVF